MITSLQSLNPKLARALPFVLLGSIAVTVVVLFLWQALGVAHTAAGFPLDDAWIHVRFAQNLAASGCFGFNPGEPTAGSTSPLWVAALAAVALFTREFVGTTLALSIASYLALVAIALWAARKAFGGHNAAALMTALIVIFNPRIGWASVSGMEVCLATMLAFLAAAVFAENERDATPGFWSQALPGVLFGLASLARPEAHLLFALAVFLRIAHRCRRDTPVAELLRLLPYRMIAIYLLVAMPWHLFSLVTSGSLLPNTFRANYRGFASSYYPAAYYEAYAKWLFVKDHPFIYWFVPPGIAAVVYETWRRGRSQTRFSPLSDFGLRFAQLAALWTVTYPAVSRLLLPMTRHHMRYMLPMTPFHALLSVVGIVAVAGIAGRLIGRIGRIGRIGQMGQIGRTGWVIVGVAFLAGAIPNLFLWAGRYAQNVYTINTQHVAMALWVRDHVPADATIAAHDIGALGAIAQRRVYDLYGLVTPEMILRPSQHHPRRRPPPNWHLQKILDSGATFLIGYPGWVGFMRLQEDCFEALRRETLDTEDIAGERAMVAFRIDTERLREALAKPQPAPD